jgi:hypothetical protein
MEEAEVSPRERDDGELGEDLENLPVKRADRALERLVAVDEIGTLATVQLALANKGVVCTV